MAIRLASLALATACLGCDQLVGLSEPRIAPEGGADARADAAEHRDSATDARSAEAGFDTGCPTAMGEPVLVTPGAEVRSLTVSGGQVLWNDSISPSSIVSVPVTGGTPTTLLSGVVLSQNIAADSVSVYFGADTLLEALPLDGGAVATLANGAPTGYLAIDPTYVYWLGSMFSFVGRVPISGGIVATLAIPPIAPDVMAVGPNGVYWIDRSGAILTVGLDGGATTMVVAGMGVNALAVDAMNVYWTATDGTVGASPLAAGPITTIASGQGYPVAVAVDSAAVYWVTAGTGLGTVVRASKAGGCVVTIASGQANPGAIALDGTNVYWENQSSGDILRAAKP